MYQIEIENVGTRKILIVADDDGRKRPAMFRKLEDAEEACRIVKTLRIDSAFIDAHTIGGK